MINLIVSWWHWMQCKEIEIPESTDVGGKKGRSRPEYSLLCLPTVCSLLRVLYSWPQSHGRQDSE